MDRLSTLRIGFACTQRWDDMPGDSQVRACASCDRQVFNLSEMTRDQAERVLAARGGMPCVRIRCRADGTVVTADSPEPPRRRLAVVSSLVALASPSLAAADPDPQPIDAPPETIYVHDAPIRIDVTYTTMGIPIAYNRISTIPLITRPRPARARIEWSVWGRIGMGVAIQHATVLARTLTPPDPESPSTWEAALAADLTFGIGRDGNLRAGVFGELRTTTDPVAGGELIAGPIVLRAGGNLQVVTGALGIGGSVVRVVGSINRSRGDPRDWSATLGLELEPIRAIHAVLDLAR